jgi:hypothetical protein
MKNLALAAAALVGSLALAGTASADAHRPGWNNHHMAHHPVCRWEWRHHHKVRVCR